MEPVNQEPGDGGQEPVDETPVRGDDEEDPVSDNPGTDDGDETAGPGNGDETVGTDDGDETPRTDDGTDTVIPGNNEVSVDEDLEINDEIKSAPKNKLPDTATTTYNSLMVGTLLLLIGLTILFISRKKLLQ